jgi:hypothetical protein
MQERSIRLLLIEHLDAPSRLSLYQKNTSGRDAEPNAFHYDEKHRLEIMARILHNVVLQRHQGLDPRDLAPRNIIILPSHYYGQFTGPELPEPRVVLVDYNNAIVFEKTKYGRCPEQDLEFPRSPAELFWTKTFLNSSAGTQPGGIRILYGARNGCFDVSEGLKWCYTLRTAVS